MNHDKIRAQLEVALESYESLKHEIRPKAVMLSALKREIDRLESLLSADTLADLTPPFGSQKRENAHTGDLRPPKPETGNETMESAQSDSDPLGGALWGDYDEKYRRHWNQSEVDLLLLLIDDGYTPRSIAEELQRPMKGVVKKAWKLGYRIDRKTHRFYRIGED